MAKKERKVQRVRIRTTSTGRISENYLDNIKLATGRGSPPATNAVNRIGDAL